MKGLNKTVFGICSFSFLCFQMQPFRFLFFTSCLKLYNIQRFTLLNRTMNMNRYYIILTKMDSSNNVHIHKIYFLDYIHNQLITHCLCRGEENPLKFVTITSKMEESTQTTGQVLTLSNQYNMYPPYVKGKPRRKSLWIFRINCHKQFSMYSDDFLLVSFFVASGIRKLWKTCIIFRTWCTKHDSLYHFAILMCENWCRISFFVVSNSASVVSIRSLLLLKSFWKLLFALHFNQEK